MARLTCPRDWQHDPHDERAIFCWVCGIELWCEQCNRFASEHLVEPCADYRAKLAS